MDLQYLCRHCQLLCSAKLIALDSQKPPASRWQNNGTPLPSDVRSFLFEDKNGGNAVEPEVDYMTRFKREVDLVLLLGLRLSASHSIRHSASVFTLPFLSKSPFYKRPCNLCTKLWKTYSSPLQQSRDQIRRDARAGFLAVPVISARASGSSRHADLEAFYRDPRSIIRCRDLSLYLTFIIVSTVDWNVVAEHSFELTLAPRGQYLISYKEPLRFDISKQTVANVIRWLRHCEQNHSCVIQSGDTARGSHDLPTRLIQIEPRLSSYNVKLVEPDPMSPEKTRLKYSSLSHRWGTGHVSLSLLRENMNDFKTRIDPKLLPRTFHEAIILTTLLGYRYIWIDALCIVQDDEADWRRESGRMRSVFSGAVVNFAASAAKGGLLVQDKAAPPLVLRTTWGISSVPAFFTVRHRLREGPGPDYVEEIARSPLNARGWVFQERLLSSRIIHFGARQIWWECRESAHCTSLGPDTSVNRDAKNYWDHDFPYDHFVSQQGWHALVSMYSETSLTRATDRLIALAGIAEAFVSRHGYQPSDYVAGLLLPHLWSGLLWEVGQQVIGKSAACVAPSWSWACSSRLVVFFPLTRWSRNSWGKAPTNDIQLPESHVGEWHPHRKVCGVRLQSDSDNLWGTRIWGYLHLKVALSRSSAQPPESKALILCGQAFSPESRFWSGGVMVYEDETLRLTYDANLKEDAGSTISREVYFMPLHVKRLKSYEATRSDWMVDESFYVGLALEKVPLQKGTFRRIGLLELNYPSSDVPLWWSGSNDLQEEDCLAEHDDGTVEIHLV